MNNVLKTQGLFAVAVGAGVMIGAAGVFLYEHVFKEKRRLILQKDVLQLEMSVSELRSELEALRAFQMARKQRKKSDNYSSDHESDMMSVIDDDYEDEFFDFSDTEDPFIPSSVQVLAATTVSSSQIYSEIDSLINQPSLEGKFKALEILNTKFPKSKSDPELLWRLAKVCHGIGMLKGLEGDMEAKKYYVEKGLEHATECLRLAPRSPNAHKWYAICVGSRGEFYGVKAKLRDGFEFKNHIDEALSISPNDPTLLHLLGRFRYEVSSLTWVERKLASTLFGDVPVATFEEAIEVLLQAESLVTEPWKENRLVLAKCYLLSGNYKEAAKWLNKAHAVPCKSLEDEVLNQEISMLRTKYKRYFS